MKSLQNKLTISMSLTLALVVLTVAAITGFIVQQRITKSIKNELSIQNRVAAVAINQALETYATEMKMVAVSDVLLCQDQARIEAYLKTVLASNPRLTTLAVLSPEGYNFASAGRWAGKQLPLLLDQARDDFFLARDTSLGKVIVNGPVMCKSVIPTLVILTPIAPNETSDAVGVLAMVASLDPINQLLLACNEDASARRIMQLVDERGNQILSDQGKTGESPIVHFGNEAVERLSVRSSVMDVSIFQATGDSGSAFTSVPGIAATHKLDRCGDGETLHWSVASTMYSHDIRARAAAIVFKMLLLCVGTIPIIVAICCWVASRLSKPIRKASDRAKAIARGELMLEPLDVKGHDELAELARCMNHMSVELKKSADTAETAVRVKSQFLANMSHEIRTPMSAILGHADLLNSPDLPNEQRNVSVDTIQRNGRHLLAVLNDILDVSKLEAGKVELEHKPVNVIQVVDDVVELIRPRVEQKQLYLKVEYSARIPDKIRSDEVRIRQILLNLVGNAVKFTERGGVTISVRWMADVHHPQLCISVSDTGVGIPPEDLDRIFEAFNQGDASVTRKFGGTGLGLRISNELAMLLGSGVQVSSEEGTGSTFYFNIDVDLSEDSMIVSASRIRNAKKQQINAAVSHADNVRVLLADDGEDNRRLFEFVLERAGIDVTSVENGIEAIEQVNAAAARGNPFDVILMDMQMPVIDGYEATMRLRDAGVSTPIIAVTANALESDRSRCIEAGCDDHLGKPIDNELLVGHCLEWCVTSRANRDKKRELAAPTSKL